MSDVRYITFDNGAPRLALPADFTDDQAREYLKSDDFQRQMYGKGWGYMYGLNPVNLLEEDNLNDNAFVAASKSAVDTLKQIGQGALATMYDVFGAEEKQKQAIQYVKQYQLDQQAHQWRKDAEGDVKQRVTSLEQVFESEQEFGAFLEWLGAKVGEGAVTSVPFVLAGLVSGGVGAGVIGAGLVARQTGMSALRQAFTSSVLPKAVLQSAGKGFLGSTLAGSTSMSGLGLMAAAYNFGAGDSYVNQLEESDDPNAALALAAGIPYAAAEGAFGAGSVLLRGIMKNTSAATLKRALNNQVKNLKKGEVVKIIKNIKKATSPQRLRAGGKYMLKTQMGEGVAESLQETITQTTQEIEGGRSLQELYASPDFWKQVGEATAAGFVGGGAFGAIGGTFQAARVGPSMNININGSVQNIQLPKISEDMATDPDLWGGLDFSIGDLVTYTGAEQLQQNNNNIDGEDFSQPNATSNATRSYVVAGTADFNGNKYVALLGKDTSTQVFVPVEDSNKILNLDKKTKVNNKEEQTGRTGSDNINLNQDGVEKEFNDNVEILKQRGYEGNIGIDEKAKKKFVDGTVKTINNNKNKRTKLNALWETWIKDGRKDMRDSQGDESFFYDIENGEELASVDDVIKEGHIAFSLGEGLDQYEPWMDDEKELRKQIEKIGWPQARNKIVRDKVDTASNLITTDDRKALNKLGYETEAGQEFIKELEGISERKRLTGITDITTNKLLSENEYWLDKGRGRKFIKKIIKDGITFEDAKAKGYYDVKEATKEKTKRETPLDLARRTSITEERIGPVTIEEFRTSVLGEGLYTMTVVDRLNAIRDLVSDLDTKENLQWVNNLEKTTIETLKNEIERLKSAGLDEQYMGQADLLEKFLTKTYILPTVGGAIGSFSENARVAINIRLEKLQNKTKKTAVDVESITLYTDHLQNIQVKRDNLNKLLATFNIEPILEIKHGIRNEALTNKAWNNFDGKKVIKQLQKLNAEYTVNATPSPVATNWMAARQGEGQPRLAEKFARNSPKILQTLKDIIKGMSLDLQVDLLPYVTDAEGNIVAAQYLTTERLVRIGLNGIPELARPGAKYTQDASNYLLYHETMHHLLRHGFFKQHEWLALKEAAEKTWMKRYNIEKRYGKGLGNNKKLKPLTYDQQIEEAISDAFADYMTGRYVTGGPIAHAFEKLKQYIIALGNALMRNGFDRPSAIFKAVDLGIVGKRYESLQRGTMVYTGGINATDIIVNRPWSGTDAFGGNNLIPSTRSWFARQKDVTGLPQFFKWFNSEGRQSSVVDDNGAPLVVMHTTRTFAPGSYIPFGEYLWITGMQEFGSKETSINKEKTAGAFNKLAQEGVWVEGGVNFDIGGGRFDNATEFLETLGVTNYIYDPFNRGDEHNENSVNKAANGQADTVTINNVLNVIKEEQNQLRTLEQAANALKAGGVAYITVFEKDKSGVGKQTSKGWQNNKTLKSYLPLVRKVFPNTTEKDIKNGIIRAVKGPTPMPFTAFDMKKSMDFGMHFTATQRHIDYIQQMNGLDVGQSWFTFKGFLNIKNPYRMPDFNMWKTDEVLNYMVEDGIITREEISSWGAMEHDTQAVYERIVQYLEDQGYDGIVYKNIGEDRLAQRAMMRPEGEIPINPADVWAENNNPPQDSWVAFKGVQFKSVLNDGGYDLSQPNMMASRQWQPTEGGYSWDRGEPLNRQQLKIVRKRVETAQQKIDTSTEEKAEFKGPTLSWFSRWLGSMREWAGDNLPMAKLFNVIRTMEDKMKMLQGIYSSKLALYRYLVEQNPAASIAIRKAQAISQWYQTQNQGMKWVKDANGQIIFRAPMDYKGGPNDLDIQPGEVVILEGDIADAFLQYDKVMDQMVGEIRKGLIAGTYAEPLREALEIINKFYKQQIPLSTDQIEDLTSSDVRSIITELRRISDILEFQNNVPYGPLTTEQIAMLIPTGELTKKEIQRMRSLSGFTATGKPNLKAKDSLGNLLQELNMYEQFAQGTYVPLMRFGEYFIKVTNPNEPKELPSKKGTAGAYKNQEGKWVTKNDNYLLYYEHFESKRDAENKMGDIQAKYGDVEGAVVSTVQKNTIKELKQIVRERGMGLVGIGQYLSESNAQTFKDLEAELNLILALNKNVVGFDAFMTPRSRQGGVPGYSSDFGRAAEQFIYMASRTAARNRYLPEASRRRAEVIADAQAREDTKLEEGVKTFYDYSLDPKQEFAALRRIGFWWYLGGNLSSAFLQIFSAIQFTGPMLAEITPGQLKFAGTRAAGQLLKAHKDALSMLTFTENQFGDVLIDWTKAPPDVIDAIIEDMATYLKAGQALQEAGQVPGTETLGSRRKRYLRQFENLIIGGAFNTAEATSRLTGYIATYRTMNDPVTGGEALKRALTLFEGNQLFQDAINRNGGVLTPQIVARHIVDDTFGVYGKLNRPAIMRKWGAVPALFQTYIIQMFALMNRMLTKGRTPGQRAAGRRAFARMTLMIVLTGGIFGLPGSDDAEDLVDWMIENIPGVGSGLKSDVRTELREMLYDAGFGVGFINALENGIVESMLNVDIQRRIALGNVPFSQQIRAITAMMGLSSGGEAADIAGAPGSVFITPIKEAATAYREGRGLIDIAMKSSPLFIRNAYKAYQQSMGKGFVETNFGTVLTDDVGFMETIQQTMGFGSARLKREREAVYMERFYQTRSGKVKRKFNARITNAYRDILIGNKKGDSNLVLDGQQRLQDLTRELYLWNSKQLPSDMIFVDLDSLWEEAILAYNQAYRQYKLPDNTFAKSKKFRQMYGLDK